MSLFKKAQSAVAHNSKIPQLGNSDLKPLQDLIHTEKAFVASNAKVAAETQNTADALRVWASGEGDDLEDVLPKVALLYEHLSRAEARYNYYVSTMRLHLKSIRTREENYAELKGRRRTLLGKIESMERKLSKMGPENKDLAKVTSSLRELRSDMEVLNNEMAHEEAALGDYKRRTIVEALGLKSGGLMELAEKAIVIAESCRLLVEEIPLQPTMPGSQRAPYRNEARTNRLLQEAVRQIETIHFEPRESQLNVDRAQASPVSPMVAAPRPEGVEMGAVSLDANQGALASRANVPSATTGVPAHGMQLLDDREQGSQGWVAPEAPVPPAEASSTVPGLPTVHEGLDTPYEWEEPSRRYANAPPPPQPEMYVPDMGAGMIDDAIPSFPPAPPAAPDVPVEDSTEDRAYFEGVGSTKALQEAAARSGGFPSLDTMNRGNQITSYMPEYGQVLSPSSLRPMAPSAPPPHLLAREHMAPRSQPPMGSPMGLPTGPPPMPPPSMGPPPMAPSSMGPPPMPPSTMGPPPMASSSMDPPPMVPPTMSPPPFSSPQSYAPQSYVPPSYVPPPPHANAPVPAPAPAASAAPPSEPAVTVTAPAPSYEPSAHAPSTLPAYLLSQPTHSLEDARPQPAMPSSGHMPYMAGTKPLSLSI